MDVAGYIAGLVDAYAPGSILTVGDRTARLLSVYLSTHPDCVHRSVRAPAGGALTASALDVAGDTSRYDLALVADTLEALDEEPGESLIAALRDLYARRLCVLVRVPLGGPDRLLWQPADMRAYGLALLTRIPGDGDGHLVYGFDLYDYKTTPDWLNPEHWANPEMWEKHRW